MTGCLQVKNNKYYAVLDERDPCGKRKRRWVCTDLPERGNKRRAQEFLNQPIAQAEDVTMPAQESCAVPIQQLPPIPAQSPSSDNIPFADYIREWLAGKKGKVEMSTWERYQTCVEKHVAPYFAEQNITLTQLAPRHVAAFYQYKFTDGRLDGKPGGLAIASIKSLGLVIKESLNTAVILEYISRNPALHVPLPRIEEKRQVGVFLDAGQANAMLKAFRGHHLQPLVYVTLYYGLRRSEVLGLRWQAIDFENNLLHINHTVVKNLTVVAKDKTKTASSKRSFDLLPEVRELLLNVRNQTQQNRKLFGREYHDSDYIFVWPNGIRYSPDYLTRGFQRVLKSNGLEKMRFHDIRHPYVKLALKNNLLQKDFGHIFIQSPFAYLLYKPSTKPLCGGHLHRHMINLTTQTANAVDFLVVRYNESIVFGKCFHIKHAISPQSLLF